MKPPMSRELGHQGALSHARRMKQAFQMWEQPIQQGQTSSVEFPVAKSWDLIFSAFSSKI
jgi:hypothetical protein